MTKMFMKIFMKIINQTMLVNRAISDIKQGRRRRKRLEKLMLTTNVIKRTRVTGVTQYKDSDCRHVHKSIAIFHTTLKFLDEQHLPFYVIAVLSLSLCESIYTMIL